LVSFNRVVPAAEAHETETNGTISALLHIVPNDDPYIKEPSYILVEFTDTTKKFSAEQCTCRVSIKQQGREVYSVLTSDQAVTKTPHSISFAYTFPEFDIYILTVEGKPNPNSNPEAFSLSYDIRVDQERNLFGYGSLHDLFGHHWHHLIPVVIIIVAAIVIIIQDRIKLKRYNAENYKK
jgi:hypothetical protein